MEQAVKEKDDLRVGLRFGEGGRYQIRERIGRGGMADVYKVVDTQLNNRLYAVKILSSTTSGTAGADVFRSLFIEEAQALSRIRDNNVVAVITNGLLNDANHTPYMVMEYLDGQDLNALLKTEKQLPVERSVDIILAVCAGIDACHLAGVIHRDLKPANIFLDQTLKGVEPKVLDFSVAKIPVSRGDKTKTDFVVGTESYMAPEQASGKPADERSDQYSIGALLYRCLTGRVPRGFLAKPRELCPELPEELETTLLRAMDPLPGRRFSSVHEFGRSLLPHASATGRAKWTHYYTTPPVALRPAFTGPVSTAAFAEPQTSASPPTRRESFDFLAHDRTTRLTDEISLPTSAPRPHPLPDTPSEVRPSSASDHPTHLKASASLATSDITPSMATASPSPRRLLFAAGGVALVLLVGILAFVLRGRDKPADVPPRPPAWTRSQPTPTPPVPPELKPLVPSPPAAVSPAPVEAVVPVTAGSDVRQEDASRPKKKRRRATPDPIQRTHERLPVLP